jgi:hypothetical protein
VPRKLSMRSAAVTLLLLGLGLAPLGCSRSDSPPSESERNLKALSVFYGRFTGQNRGKGPTNEADFKKFVHSLNPEMISSFGLDPNNLDKAFISPRDNEPYGVAYTVSANSPGANGVAPMVIWEQKGVHGKHYIADALGKIEEIDEATFQQRLAATKASK